jgi:glycosyltransferase involved in cell wall biosynthesis
MKVLRVISSMNPENGGPCQGIRNSVPELSKLGVISEVVSLDAPDSSFLNKDSFPIRAIGPAKNAWCYNAQLLPWLIKNLNKYDVVIVHGLWQYHGYAVYKAIKHLRKYGRQFPKYYVMPHGMLDPYFQKSSGRKLKALRNKIYWKYLESYVVNNADGLLFTCKAELLLARETFDPYKPKQELNVGYGIEVPPFYSDEMKHAFTQKWPLIVKTPFILFLSRIHPKKGVDILIQAYLELIRCGMQLPFLMIAGPGLETDYGQRLIRDLNKNSELYNKIGFTGMLSGDEKWGAFYGCQAFILPSHQENFGIAVVEALACCKPVLITNQVNIWREISETGGGLVEDDDLEGVKRLLTCWVNLSEVEQHLMGVNAEVSFKNYFLIKEASQKFYMAIKNN